MERAAWLPRRRSLPGHVRRRRGGPNSAGNFLLSPHEGNTFVAETETERKVEGRREGGAANKRAGNGGGIFFVLPELPAPLHQNIR